MKILHLDFDDLESPTAGGQAVRTFEINRRLVKKGHDVTVITMSYPGAKNMVREGVKYERCGTKFYPLNFISWFLSVPFVLHSHTFDLVVEENFPPVSFGLSPLYTRKPVIAQIQSLFAEQSSKKHHLPFWFIEKHAAKLYKNFIVLTENVQNKIRMLNKKARIQIIPNGLSNIYPLHSTHKNQLLFLGRIDYHHKGINHLINICKLLEIQLPQFQIIIAGDGRDRQKLETQIQDEQKNGRLRNTKYIGKITGNEKEELIKNSVLLLLPSRFETQPFSMLEAAAHGKPAAFFDIPNLHELIKKNIGVGAPAFDEKLFAETVVRTINDQNLLETLGNNAHVWAKEHLWDTIVEEQEKFYLSCL